MNPLTITKKSIKAIISPLNERRAWFVYEAARLAAMAAYAPIIPPPWEMREAAFQRQFKACIEKQTGPERLSSPEALHNQWWDEYKKMGWKYGPARDALKKTHPDMVPYSELDILERDKDEVFMALCEIARQWIYDLPSDATGEVE